MSKMAVILIVAIAPTNLEAADTAFRFQNPVMNEQFTSWRFFYIDP